jgi:hypothetical protein
MLGQVQGSDALFKIYTERYLANPIVIPRARARAHVVFGNVLRRCNKVNEL